MVRLRQGLPSRGDKSPDISERHLWDFRFVRDIFWLFAALLILLFCYEIMGILLPLIIAFGCAYISNPLIVLLERRFHISRQWATTLILCITLLILVILFSKLIPLVIKQTINLAESLPDYAGDLKEWLSAKVDNIYPNLPVMVKSSITVEQIKEYFNIQQIVTQLSKAVESQIQPLYNEIQNDPVKFLKSIVTGTQTTMGIFGSGTSQAIGFIGNVISSTTIFLVNVVLIPFYYYFIALYYDDILAYIDQYLPSSHKQRISEIISKMDSVIIGFFSGRVIIALIMGGLLSFGWWLADVPYWFLLGMITGLMNIIPYVSVFGWPVAILLKHLDALKLVNAVVPVPYSLFSILFWPSLVFGIVHVIEAWFLTPLIQSNSTDMDMVSIIIVMLIGGSLFGILGLLFAVPIAACIKILWREVISPRIIRAAQNS